MGELSKGAEALAGDGIIQLQGDLDFASSTDALRSHHAEYEKQMADALAFTKPTFNEEMRSGQTNM